MNHHPMEDDKPWYKQFWPWFIISIPGTAVVASMFLINSAIQTADGLVSDDYYKEGLAINQDLSKTRFAQTLGLRAVVLFDPDTRELRANLSGKLTSPPPLLELQLVHPTVKGLDEKILMTLAGDGLYLSRLPEIPKASWRVSLAPSNSEWKLTGRARFPQSSQVTLEP
ncbi:MAG: FixH family protein [Gammaproteobacteria bacterium]|nr:FixH family protein [Gammaproteobacteria bacterium]